MLLVFATASLALGLSSEPARPQGQRPNDDFVCGTPPSTPFPAWGVTFLGANDELGHSREHDVPTYSSWQQTVVPKVATTGRMRIEGTPATFAVLPTSGAGEAIEPLVTVSNGTYAYRGLRSKSTYVLSARYEHWVPEPPCHGIEETKVVVFETH